MKINFYKLGIYNDILSGVLFFLGSILFLLGNMFIGIIFFIIGSAEMMIGPILKLKGNSKGH